MIDVSIPSNIETFISYARKDGLEYAERLERELPNTWRDKRGIDPTKDFTVEIERAIEACKQVIVCITTDTLREDSFVRREIVYAQLCKKPIIVVRFEDVLTPITVVNNTWIDQFKLGWEQTLAEIRRWMQSSPTYKPPAFDDPYRSYLDRLYDSIVAYLDKVIIREVTLKAQDSSDKVVAPLRQANLLGGFFAQQGYDAPREPIETLQEGMARFKERLLLLGGPGAGKTVSLMAAARDAVVKRLNDPKAPLPVVLRCAEWQSDPPLPLRDWVRQQTTIDLPEFDQTFVFLDGFDELGERRVKKVRTKGEDGKEDGKEEEREETYDPRPLFLEIIPKTGRVLLSCRSQEYEAFGRKVDLNGAVTLKPLTDAQIAEYLADMPALWEALQRDGALLEMVRTPLLLSLFAFGYRDAPKELKALENVEAGELNDVIFRRYVESRYAYEARRLKAMEQQPPFTREEVYAGLGRVAMRNAAGFYGVQDNVLKADDFARVEGLALQGERLRAFAGFAASLHLLVNIEGGAWRFMHLRLRDYFARDHAPQCLKDANEYVRRAAAEALGAIGDGRAVEPLVAALEDANSDVRRAAAEALGAIGDGRAVEPLVAALEDADSDVRRAAAEALGKLGWQPPTQELRITYLFAKQGWDHLVDIGAPAVAPLVAALKDAASSVRRAAAGALGKLGWQPPTQEQRIAYLFAKQDWDHLVAIGAPAVEPLVAALKDADWHVRRAAAEALGKLGDGRAVAPLVAALKDRDDDVRRAAAEALVKIGAPAVAPLVAALKDKNSAVRRAAAEALGKLGDGRAVAPLVAALEDADSDVRRAAAEALGKLGDGRAVAPLVAALKDRDDDVRRAAAEALGKLGWQPPTQEQRIAYLFAKQDWNHLVAIGAPAVEPLVAALKDDAWDVRRAAARALGAIGDGRAVAPLVAALKDEDSDVRRAAAEALGAIGDGRAVEPLVAALKDEDSDVRRAAAEALGAIGDGRAVEPLVAALKDANSDVCYAAAEVL